MKRVVKWIAVVLVAVLAIVSAYYYKNQGISAEAAAVYKGEIKQYLEETAEVISREKQTVYIEGSGKVLNIAVKEGDAVKKGDSLLTLDKTDLELQLRDADAKIQAAMAQLKGTDLANYANKIEQAKVAVEQAKIAYDSAQRSYESAKKLNDSKALSKEELDKAQDAFKTAETALSAANLQLSDVKQGAPEYIKSSYQAQLEQAYVYRDTVLRNLQKQELRSPMDGIIMEKLIEGNSPAIPATPAFVIGDVQDLELEAYILADDAGKIKLGNEVEISGKPIGDILIKGRLAKIAPAAKTMVSALGVNQKRISVTIELLNKSSILKPGYKLDIKIITEVRPGVNLIPDTAVFQYKKTDNVFVIENGMAVLRPVIKGIESGDTIEIREGLNVGDIVLVKPDNAIKEGTKIKAEDKVSKGSVKTVQ